MKKLISLLIVTLIVLSHPNVIAVRDSYTDTEYLCGFIDKEGKILGEIKYYDVKAFGKDLAPVCIENKWGLIDKKGNFIVEPIYLDALSSPEGGGSVLAGEYWLSVDSNGNIISKTESAPDYLGWEEEILNYSEAYPEKKPIGYGNSHYCGNGIYFTSEDNNYKNYGFVDANGNKLSNFDFEYPGERPIRFCDGLLSVRKNNLTGFVDKDLNLIINYQFEYADEFCDGMAKVFKDGKIGYINTKGELVVDYIWDSHESMYTFGHYFNGFAAVAKISKMATPPSSWAKDEVEKALEVGLIPSHLQGHYQRYISRNDLTVTLGSSLYDICDISLDKFAEEYNPDYQRPIFNDWTNAYTYILNRLDILRGRDDYTLGLKDNITRQEFATIVYRTINVFSNNYKSPSHDIKFNDDAKIAEWAKDSAYTLNSMKIFLGTDDGNFLPDQFITREETYVVIYRMYNLLKSHGNNE